MLSFASGPADSSREGSPRYADRVAALEALRVSLAAEHRAARTPRRRRAILARARAALVRAVADDLFPAWYGTPWAYDGTTTVPREGKIACGYFVSTILRDAGFRVERVPLAQQAAENIVRTLVPSAQTWRFRNRPLAEVLAAVRARGDGLFLVGLDNHVGFLLRRAGRLDFCHSSYLGAQGVACEPAETSAALPSRYYVVGRLFTDPLLARWREGRRIRTRTR
jgi:hypothetical protein